MTTKEDQELQNLLNLVQPYLDNVTSFKIILLLLLTESEYCPSFKRLHTAFASVILKNASGSDRPESEILGPYFQTLKRTKRIYQLIKEFIQEFHHHWRDFFLHVPTYNIIYTFFQSIVKLKFPEVIFQTRYPFSTHSAP